MNPMVFRRNRKAETLSAQLAGIALAAPQVVGYRLARMYGLAGRSPLSDRRELYVMGAEKVAAFYESWNAMLIEMIRANMKLFLAPALFWPLSAAAPRRGSAHIRRTGLAMLGKGVAPIHRRVVANANRLGRRTCR
jgi:hypothetical protein